MFKYCKITCSTPFVGEENEYFYKFTEPEQLAKYIPECVYKNAMEWFDPQIRDLYHDEDQYIAVCSYVWEYITKEEYYENCPWDKEEDNK